MQCLFSQSTDPRFNLATEEYLLKSTTENIIFLYHNTDCCIVGKHQNAMAETNHRFITENNIPVIRRISGGGTVYHDPGNLNFTFIQNGEEGKLVNFRTYILPIVEYLATLGIHAEIGIRNDILVNGLKISGNAEHIYKKRTLHHGTLLFSSNLPWLRGALFNDSPKYTDRAVKSVRSSVANIIDFLPHPITFQLFTEQLKNFLQDKFQAQPLYLSEDIHSFIHLQAQQKYSDWNWNYGYSPAYTFLNKFQKGTKNYSIYLAVEKGLIQQAVLDFPEREAFAEKLSRLLINSPHAYETISTMVFQDENLSDHKDFSWFFF